MPVPPLGFLLIAAASLPLLTFPATAADVELRCDAVPYPDQCRYYLTHRVGSAPKQGVDFRELTVQAALDRAVQARLEIAGSETRFDGSLQRAAWAECFRFHDYTVRELNRTIVGLYGSRPRDPSCTGFDAQTWLSAALTNLQTCRDSSTELGVPDLAAALLFPANVSELISNSLAVNRNSAGGEAGESGSGVPDWVDGGGRRRLLQARRSSVAATAKVVVAQDGSGGFRTVQAAIDAAARRGGGSIGRMFVIYVKQGKYRENIEVRRNLDYVMLVGDGMRRTVITGNRNAKDGLSTYNTATAGIDGIGFVARGIAFVNSAGPERAQAVALRSSSDLSVFYRCAFHGFQDTLFAHSQRQFYRQCYVYGTVDFIFGNAVVVFQGCMIYARAPLSGQRNVITAQGRGDANQNSGTSIHDSQIRAAPDLQRASASFETYLGRPWQQYSRTVIMRTYIGSLVEAEGWSDWDNTDFAQATLYYGEFNNFGPSAATGGRVKWPGYHVITDPREAAKFTVARFIAGGSWLPAVGVPFTSGL